MNAFNCRFQLWISDGACFTVQFERQFTDPIVLQSLMLRSLATAGTFWLHWPVLVVYACTCLDEVGKIPWVIAYYRKYGWVKDLTREDIS